MIWRCPQCRGELRQEPRGELLCASCAAIYPSISGIPDLRINAPAWIDSDADREQARWIAKHLADRPVEEVVRHAFREVRGHTSANADHHTRRVTDAPARLRREIVGWLNDATARAPFLDLGCGPGMLLAAAAADGRRGIGIDVSMVWLVVAQRLIREHRGTPVLAAAFAESLPLQDGAVTAVVSLDVIEHVGDQVQYVREIDRVTAPGGRVALSTPNRFSIAAEPHVHVWGVGWLPRRWQQPYAEWRSGISYAFTRLLSTSEARELLARHTRFDVELLVPEIPEEDIAIASPRRAALARAYNRVIRFEPTRRAALLVGAFFQVAGRKLGELSAHAFAWSAVLAFD
ncbi:MAG: class SAM-dependent methyltransferase [Gemmatimonadetes bacterium]|nr:class SAM-dependent methyltransferase [Gemmatimonadota bacterium]